MSKRDFAACIIKRADEWNEFVEIARDESGLIGYFPSVEHPGYMDAATLRILADELDRRNAERTNS